MRLKVPLAASPEAAGIWERCIDQRRRAVYYWEHNSRVSSWDAPKGGWWERLQAETGHEFFWNSETQETVWLGALSFLLTALSYVLLLLGGICPCSPLACRGRRRMRHMAVCRHVDMS